MEISGQICEGCDKGAYLENMVAETNLNTTLEISRVVMENMDQLNHGIDAAREKAGESSSQVENALQALSADVAKKIRNIERSVPSKEVVCKGPGLLGRCNARIIDATRSGNENR